METPQVSCLGALCSHTFCFGTLYCHYEERFGACSSPDSEGLASLVIAELALDAYRGERARAFWR